MGGMSMNGKVHGSLIIVGGHEEKDNEAERPILEEIAARARRRKGNLVVVTVATQLPEEVAADYRTVFRELGVRDLDVVDIRSREDALDYAEEFGIPVTSTLKSIYSRDRNLFHLSHEGGPLENPWNEPEEDMYKLSVSPENAPNEAEYVEIDFEQGVPMKVNGEKLPAVDLFIKLNQLAAKHGIGRIDLVENRLVGMKSHGVYETPGGTMIHRAHQALESICLDKATMHYKDILAVKYAELVYNGLWYTRLHEALDAFVGVTQENVTGTVRLKLYKGNIIIAGRKSPFSLYREDYASFGEEDVYDQKDAEGFIQLFGLPVKVEALLTIDGGGKSRYRQPDYSKFKRD